MIARKLLSSLLHCTHGQQRTNWFGLLLSLHLVVCKAQKTCKRDKNARGTNKCDGYTKNNGCHNNGEDAANAIQCCMVNDGYSCQDKG
jgi:hypothetical protein